MIKKKSSENEWEKHVKITKISPDRYILNTQLQFPVSALTWPISLYLPPFLPLFFSNSLALIPVFSPSSLYLTYPLSHLFDIVLPAFLFRVFNRTVLFLSCMLYTFRRRVSQCSYFRYFQMLLCRRMKKLNKKNFSLVHRGMMKLRKASFI